MLSTLQYIPVDTFIEVQPAPVLIPHHGPRPTGQDTYQNKTISPTEDHTSHHAEEDKGMKPITYLHADLGFFTVILLHRPNHG